MKAFEFLRPSSLEAASRVLTDEKGALLKAGGVDLLDRMKERVDEPEKVVGLVDIRDGAACEIRETGETLSVGALVTLTEIAESEVVRRLAPTLAEAAEQAASRQIRNLATLGGNLAQHTRCGYYRFRSFPCFKRGDATCPVRADGAVQEMAGIFGNDPCACAHPSSLAPVLGTLDAQVGIRDAEDDRTISFGALWIAPRRGVASDLALAPGELITHVEIPVRPRKTGYVEIRQKAAFDWPLVACAVSFVKRGEKVADARVWLGAVAPMPWACAPAERILEGSTFHEARAEQAAEAARQGATPLAGNVYKVELVKVAVKRALMQASERG